MIASQRCGGCAGLGSRITGASDLEPYITVWLCWAGGGGGALNTAPDFEPLKPCGSVVTGVCSVFESACGGAVRQLTYTAASARELTTAPIFRAMLGGRFMA